MEAGLIYRWLADLTALIHFGFVLFVVFGALLVAHRPRLAWLHLPAVAWGVAIEWGGWICPLTPLENRLRLLGAAEGYGGGFVEHYLLPVLYPGGLTRTAQWVLGALVLAINTLIYARLAAKWRSRG